MSIMWNDEESFEILRDISNVPFNVDLSDIIFQQCVDSDLALVSKSIILQVFYRIPPNSADDPNKTYKKLNIRVFVVDSKAQTRKFKIQGL